VKRILLLLVCTLVPVLAGCGYRVGSIGNPQIKSIAFAPIVNETPIPGVREYMRQALAEAFQFDSSYKVKDLYTADCVLYGRITNAELSATNITSSPTGSTFITREFTITLTFEFTVIIPGQADALIPATQVTGSSQYQVPIDQFQSQASGALQACRRIAQEVVWDTAEGW